MQSFEKRDEAQEFLIKIQNAEFPRLCRKAGKAEKQKYQNGKRMKTGSCILLKMWLPGFSAY